MTNPTPLAPEELPELPDAINWLKSEEVNAGPRTVKAIAAVLAALATRQEAVPAGWVNLLPGWDDGKRRVFTDAQAAAEYHDRCYDLTPVYTHPAPATPQAAGDAERDAARYRALKHAPTELIRGLIVAAPGHWDGIADAVLAEGESQ